MTNTQPITSGAELTAAYNALRLDICNRLAPGKDPARVRLAQVIQLEVHLNGAWFPVTAYLTDMRDKFRDYAASDAVVPAHRLVALV